MGRISIPWKVSIVANIMGFSPNGIDAHQLALVTGSLPGQTTIISITALPITGLSRDFEITAENDVLADGTVVDMQWTRHAKVDNSVPGGKLIQFTIFSGVKIIDPPTNNVSNPAGQTSSQGWSGNANGNLPPGPTPIRTMISRVLTGGKATVKMNGVPIGSLDPVNICTHPTASRKRYQGFTDSYDYCDLCGERIG